MGTAAAALGVVLSATELTSLDISGSTLEEEAMQALGDALLGNAACKVGGIKCRAFKVPAAATSLNLNDRHLHQGAATLLAGVLKFNAVLTDLNLYLNKIGPEGATAIAKALEVNRVLTECNVRGNKFDTESATALAKAATEKRVMLFGIKHDQTEANFGGQRLGPVDAILIASDLRVSRVLTEVLLGDNDIGPSG